MEGLVHLYVLEAEWLKLVAIAVVEFVLVLHPVEPGQRGGARERKVSDGVRVRESETGRGESGFAERGSHLRAWRKAERLSMIISTPKVASAQM